MNQAASTPPSLTSRLLDRIQSSAEVAVAGLVLASAATSAQAVALIPEPSLTLEQGIALSHNSSGFFSGVPQTGSASGQVAGALSEGFKLYGNASLLASQYMFNTYDPDLYGGWGGYRSNATGVSLMWWGKASNLRQASYDYDAEGNWVKLSAGDSLAFNYEFTLSGDTGASVALHAGFTNYAPNYSPYASSSLSLYSSSNLYEYLDESDGGSATFTGTLTGNELDAYSLESLDDVYWVVQLIATHAYGPTATLSLTVPQNSIDVAINQPPVVTSVPEPTSISLALSGLLAAWFLARPRRR